MDTIKKKLGQLKADKEKALDEKDAAEAQMKEALEREEQVNKTQQKVKECNVYCTKAFIPFLQQHMSSLTCLC